MAVFFKRWKFTILLVALITLFVLHPFLGAEDPFSLLYSTLLALVFAAVISVLFQRKKSRVAGLILGIPTIGGLIAHYFIPGLPRVSASILYHLLPIIFFTYTVVIVLRTIFKKSDVTTDSINGAFCGYMMLGLLFGHIYCLIETFQPDSFHLAEHVGDLPADDSRRHALLAYFSLITLTTVGFGDITPSSPAARSFACIEAVIGQFYVAVVVAELIALKVSAALRDQRPPMS